MNPVQKEENKNTVDNKTKALTHIKTVLSKYKIVKLPVMIQTVIKNTFGDLSKDEARADKAFNAVSNLLNELIDSGEISSFRFEREVTDGEKAGVLQETILVESGFEIVGYEPIRIDAAPEVKSIDETQTQIFGDTDTGGEHSDNGDDDEDDDASFDDETNALIENRASGYAVITLNSVSGSGRDIWLRNNPADALGKYLQLAGADKDPELFALIPVELEIKTMAGKLVQVEDSDGEEPEQTATEQS